MSTVEGGGGGGCLRPSLSGNLSEGHRMHQVNEPSRAEDMNNEQNGPGNTSLA